MTSIAPERLDAVLTMVSGGSPLQRACVRCAVSRDQFYSLLNRDGALAKRYAQAVQQQTAARFGAAIDCTGD